VTTAPDDETPADNLYLASQFHARRAQELLDSKDRFERMDAAYHAGAAVELMAKALVSQFDHRGQAPGSGVVLRVPGGVRR